MNNWRLKIIKEFKEYLEAKEANRLTPEEKTIASDFLNIMGSFSRSTDFDNFEFKGRDGLNYYEEMAFAHFRNWENDKINFKKITFKTNKHFLDWILSINKFKLSRLKTTISRLEEMKKKEVYRDKKGGKK